jgi:ribosomal-protein-alanine N-acetyltransferase
VTSADELRTPRLLLRRWRLADRAPYASLNADPEVMRFFPSTLTRERSDAHVDRIEAHFALHGFGLWAVEVPGEVAFIGFVGLDVPAFDAHFTPAVEIGWRLAKAHWGEGYATEAARAVLDDAFTRLEIAAVVSMTAVPNEPSQRVMQRLGMHRDPADDFDHPNVPAGHWLRRHVLYRLTADEWRQYRSQS